MTKKSLGQHFLRDEKILKKIVSFAQIKKGEKVVEIGPGKGGLTKELLISSLEVLVIEKDEKLSEELREKFEEEIKNKRLQVIIGDILDYKPENKDFKLVGNIPYYITGAIFEKFLQSQNEPRSITFVIQKEVAQRIMAKDKKESLLSISIKAYGTPEYGGIIKAGSFHPRPKVDSAIIAIRDISKRNFELHGLSEEKFFTLVKTGFSHKRKLLIKNLKPLLRPEHDIEMIFDEIGIDKKIRAEDVGVHNWFNLAKRVML